MLVVELTLLVEITNTTIDVTCVLMLFVRMVYKIMQKSCITLT